MNFFILSSLAAFLLNFLISLIFFFKSRGKLPSTNLGYGCLLASVWGLGCFLSSLANSVSNALLWFKIAHIGTILTPAVYFDFTYNLVKKTYPNRKIITTVIYIIAFIFLALNFFYDNFYKVDYYFNSIYFFRCYFSDNFYYIIFYLIFYLFLVLYSLFLLIRHLKNINPNKKNQIKYFILGSFVGWSGPEGMYLFIIFHLPVYPYSNILIAIMPLIFAYAILRHHLLDINIVIRKGLIYSFLIALITSIYFIFILFISRIFQSAMGYSSYIVNLLAVFLIALLFAPLKNKIQYLVDRNFFKGTLTSLAHEKAKLEEELRRSDRIKAVSTLAAGMAHEIKNPLTSIKTFTEYLDKNKGNPEFIDKFKRIVGSEVDRINSIVHQLLDFAKPAALRLKNCDIHRLLDETLTLLSNDLLKYNIKLIKQYNAQNLNLQADPNRLKQAFLNIILNAIEVMPNGGILTVSTDQLDDELSIAIKDTGKGISEKDLPHIFDPFFSTSEKGTGLGLSITHGIIKEHNGRIEVKSKVGLGSEFRIILYRF
ncbi:MAG: ATP-binding protein [Candidatus Omnitrophota bacterium]